MMGLHSEKEGEEKTWISAPGPSLHAQAWVSGGRIHARILGEQPPPPVKDGGL